MIGTSSRPNGFWRTAWLLLKASRRRAKGRQRRQRQLWGQRAAGATDWGGIGVVFGLLFMALVHALAGIALSVSVIGGQQIERDRAGQLVVSPMFYSWVNETRIARTHDEWVRANDELQSRFAPEAKRIARRWDRPAAEVEQRLRAVVAAQGTHGLISSDYATSGLGGLGSSGRVTTMLGSFVLLWWFAMLVSQGEGLELDLQRRRHPMWEWLLSHPVAPGAVFFAEMLAPLAANPVYWAAPLFVTIAYAMAQDTAVGLAAGVLIGVPLTIAAACLGRALEIGAMLRLPPRSRGAVIGLVSWFGYASMFLLLFTATGLPRVISAFAKPISYLADLMPWPWLGWMLGLGGDGQFSLVRGVINCWVFSAVLIALAVLFSGRSVRRGLDGQTAAEPHSARSARSVPAMSSTRSAGFGRDPLFRKEVLWFVRDRSAVVQTILIPITVAAFQIFNLRGVFRHAQDSWNYLAGAAIFFGTYFLWVLGPKSLNSEGSALWLALTWPRGLESMLKAKAWLWSLIASGLVGLVLLAGCWFFPADSWKIALVGLGWFVFARSMAEKSVTLVTVTSESGEVQKVPSGRRWAAQLGMLTFAIGIVSGQWHLAVVGIVYSWITAAAMWENLRARLPFLFDPWSEQRPQAPTLMHAMVAISILVECTSVMTAFFVAIGGRELLAGGQAIGYAICAVFVSIGVSDFMERRGVTAEQIWNWRDLPEAGPQPLQWFRRYIAADRREVSWLLVGLVGGLVLGLFAHGYSLLIAQIPWVAEQMHAARVATQGIPGFYIARAVIAIGFAPIAEEYLFRGLVFRTLDRHWGGWRAVLGAAAFFAIYHPALAWLPVGLLGAVNCLLFKRSGRLAPAVVLHTAYNLTVTLLG